MFRGRMVGSPPLARGLRDDDNARVRVIGITPARAGFTLFKAMDATGKMDHPRSRGVYPCGRRSIQCWPGSPPLARGLPVLGPEERRFARITPARAGFTISLPLSAWVRWDHPRSRGVYDFHTPDPPSRVGSPPLARGLPRAELDQYLKERITPARAGFTLADPWNPNEPTLYQTPAAFTADLGPAPPGRDSAVEFGAALSTAGRAGRDLAAAGLRPWFGHPPDTHRRVATTSG